MEWTVPYHGSIFHLGIHNLPPADAQSWMSAMATYTASRDENLLREILSTCAAIPEVLIVLNHPFWLEEGVKEIDHQPALDRILREYVMLDGFTLSNSTEHADGVRTQRSWNSLGFTRVPWSRVAIGTPASRQPA